MQLSRTILLALPLCVSAAGQAPQSEVESFLVSLGYVDAAMKPAAQLLNEIDARLQLIESIEDGPGMPDAWESNQALWDAHFGGGFVVGTHGYGSTLSALPHVMAIGNGTLVGGTPFSFDYVGLVPAAPDLPPDLPASAVMSFCVAFQTPLAGEHLGYSILVDATQYPDYAGLPLAQFSFFSVVPMTRVPDGPLTGSQIAAAWTLSMNGAFAAEGALDAWLDSQLAYTQTTIIANPWLCTIEALESLAASIAGAVASLHGNPPHDPGNIPFYDGLIDDMLSTPASDAIRSAGSAIAQAVPGLSIVQGVANALGNAVAVAEGGQEDSSFQAKLEEAKLNLAAAKQQLMDSVCASIQVARNRIKACIDNSWGEGTWNQQFESAWEQYLASEYPFAADC